ncbi:MULTISPECIES: ArsR/SmtB family transcription factor [Microbacterium]|uniref:ArsR/SmtB family transcription factor n=1 Tax=Microbacterium TaxID=33882 RepID=UPI001EF72F24|nr:metalloregulator ArsR/SmtB family transcription factor [Microbacterium aurum]
MFSDPNRPLYEVKAGLFKGLAHPIRIRILEVLSTAPEVAVSDLIEATSLEASHLSQHLAVLRRNRLVEADRRGSQVFYRLAYPQVADLLRVARTLLGEILATTQQQLIEQSGLPAIPDHTPSSVTA